MATTTVAAISPRATESQAPTQTNSSLFTFLIALLILFCASAALILRTVLRRRRIRNGSQGVLDPGIRLAPLLVKKPRLSEIWVRLASNGSDWHALTPLCAVVVNKDTDPTPTRTPVVQHPSRAAPFMRLIRHRAPATVPPIQSPPPQSDDPPLEPSTVQVTVLIAMPTEHSSIPPYDPSTTSPHSSKGKRRNSASTDDPDPDGVPDVIFGVSTLLWPRTVSHDL